MKVRLRNPNREVEIAGPRRVSAILRELDINPESVLVICGDELLTRDEEVAADSEIEIRPVISGGAP
ncbi:MAG: MoaD/ThiS family protein [Acidimicrobiia bacterium]|nr:MoaD/ThiS family protein [Acidimicrobiia bacterium]